METAAINLSLGGKAVGESELALILSRLTGPELQKLDKILKAPAKWELRPGAQTEAANTEAFETLFGGRAAGGKTELIAWLTRHQHHSSLVLRRSFPELERTLIPRMLQKYAEPKRYNQTAHLWRWPDGRRIELSYLDNLKDVFKYQGAEIDGFFPDELTQFPRDWYLYLFSRIRTSRAGQRTRCLATTNPGGEGEAWVKQRWAPWLDKNHPRPAKSGELRWFKRIASESDYAEEELIEEQGRSDPMAWSRTFIEAKMLPPEFVGVEYQRNLDMQPEPWRSQLMNGDWEIGSTDHAWQVIPSAWLEAAHQRYRNRTKFVDGKPQPPEGCSVMNALGIDVARGGKCKTVLAPGYDNWYPPLITFPGKETPDGQAILGQVATLGAHGHRVTAATVIKVDVIGVGSSPYDHLKGRYNAVAMNGGPGSKARDKASLLGFASRRAQWYWQLREALDPVTGDGLMIAPDSELDADLTAPTWEPRSGKIVVEPKDEIEKRLGRSPDKGDGFVYATAQPSAEHGLGTGGFYDDLAAGWSEAKKNEQTDEDRLAEEQADKAEADEWFGKA